MARINMKRRGKKTVNSYTFEKISEQHEISNKNEIARFKKHKMPT